MAGEAELVLQCCSRQRSGPEKDVRAQRCVCLAGAHPAVTGCPTNCSVIALALWRVRSFAQADHYNREGTSCQNTYKTAFFMAQFSDLPL